MKCKTTKLRDAVIIALAASAMPAGAAFAQDSTQTLDKIEVTGSRIKRADVETSQPVFTMSREQIQAQGQTSIGDIIQNQFGKSSDWHFGSTLSLLVMVVVLAFMGGLQRIDKEEEPQKEVRIL